MHQWPQIRFPPLNNKGFCLRLKETETECYTDAGERLGANMCRLVTQEADKKGLEVWPVLLLSGSWIPPPTLPLLLSSPCPHSTLNTQHSVCLEFCVTFPIDTANKQIFNKIHFELHEVLSHTNSLSVIWRGFEVSHFVRTKTTFEKLV